MKLGRGPNVLLLLGLVVVVVGCHDQVIVGIEPPLATAVGSAADAGRDGGPSDTEQDEDDSDDEEVEAEGGAADEPSDDEDQSETTN